MAGQLPPHSQNSKSGSAARGSDTSTSCGRPLEVTWKVGARAFGVSSHPPCSSNPRCGQDGLQLPPQSRDPSLPPTGAQP